MIGCEILKKIKIKCLVSNSLDIYKYHIKIYDSKGNIICDSSADDRGILYFEPKCFEVYKVVVNICAKIYPNTIIRNVVFTDNLLQFNIKRIGCNRSLNRCFIHRCICFCQNSIF